jgi:hypothetical protein
MRLAALVVILLAVITKIINAFIPANKYETLLGVNNRPNVTRVQWRRDEGMVLMALMKK